VALRQKSEKELDAINSDENVGDSQRDLIKDERSDQQLFLGLPSSDTRLEGNKTDVKKPDVPILYISSKAVGSGTITSDFREQNV